MIAKHRYPHNSFRECIGPYGCALYPFGVDPVHSLCHLVSVHLDRSNVQHLQLHAWRLSSSVWQLHSELVLKLVLVRNDHAHVVCMFVRRALFCFGFDIIESLLVIVPVFHGERIGLEQLVQLLDSLRLLHLLHLHDRCIGTGY